MWADELFSVALSFLLFFDEYNAAPGRKNVSALSWDE